MTRNRWVRMSCVLVLAVAAACSSGGGGTTDPGTTVTDTGADTGADVPAVDVPGGNACFPCLVEGKAFRFDSIAVTEPSDPKALPDFLNSLWQPDICDSRLNIMLRVDKVTTNGDGLIVDFTAGSGWPVDAGGADIPIASIEKVIDCGGTHPVVPAAYRFVEGSTSTFKIEVDKDCRFKTTGAAGLLFHPGTKDHGLVCSNGDAGIGLPSDTIPIANLAAEGAFSGECATLKVASAKLTGCIAENAACQICSFMLAPDYKGWRRAEDEAVTPKVCDDSYCNRWCGKSASGMPIWTNFGGFTRMIGTPLTCDLDKDGTNDAYGLAGSWTAESVTFKP